MKTNWLNFEDFKAQVKAITASPITFDLMLKRISPDEREWFIEGLYFGVELVVLLHNFSAIMELSYKQQISPTNVFTFCATWQCTLQICQIRPDDMYDLEPLFKTYNLR